MPTSDSEDETLEEFEVDDEAEADGEDETLDVGADDATEDGDYDSASEDSDEGSDDEEDDDNDSEILAEALMEIDLPVKPVSRGNSTPSPEILPPPEGDLFLRPYILLHKPLPTVQPIAHKRSLSPAQLRKNGLVAPVGVNVPSGSYTVEAICAIPHPVPTHALASSLCMTHLITGSDDGYIRDYDIFSAVNGKNFLTAPQRHHSGVVEGIMKQGQLRFWWENPFDGSKLSASPVTDDPPSLSPVYSLAMQSDALWTLAGTDVGKPAHLWKFSID
ncbi:hypothetical protein H0H81_005647 [Sphagnurus paluster]|uniref:Transcription factor spt8 beta-propeller domain-containing protein n=1 Tax=Sphagnurus paluster TaxID=117069 RepID=A0A9P7GSA0_9AGAR|nr:hypothetical protein H0H81_005647 [Sphagnurus paluster]